MLIGHQQILNFLKRSIANERVAHAYLFAGPAHLGKYTTALEFIKMLNGWSADRINHPDVLIIEPGRSAESHTNRPETDQSEQIKKESGISISQIKKIQHQIGLSPYEAQYKTVVIRSAGKMTPEAGNCLLKTLEEPLGRAVLILICSSPQRLLPTIVSRCQLVKFLPVPEKEIEKELALICNKETVLERIARLANGRPGLAISYLKEPALLKEQRKIISDLEELIESDLNRRYKYVESIAKDAFYVRRVLNCWTSWFRDLLLAKLECNDWLVRRESSKHGHLYSLTKLKEIIDKIQETDLLIANASINMRLALEVLMLEL